ncbi:1-acyl-sn-glycerol-3-phosphate acyltransferase [Streptosporangiaceae bacterium NEAU-GS5]|nr:1-acyl-sn-glycerol-3-phosphate acyltransferase [Streptosporangiaceae bacterium NEAU-GS5]
MNPWLPAAPCSTSTCIDPPVATVGPVRQVLRLVGAMIMLLSGVPVSFAARVFSTERRTRITQTWARGLLRALGVRVDSRNGFAFMGGSGSGAVSAIDGPDTGVLLVGNHISWLDPLITAAMMPCRLLAKSEVGRWPVIGTLATGSGALFIDRTRMYALPDAVADVAAALREGHTVVAFPEGTTWCGRGMGAFRPAVFQAVVDAGAVVRPMALRFHSGGQLTTGPCYVGNDSLVASILRVTALRDLVAEVTLFPPVRPTLAGIQARKALARLTEAQVRTSVTDSHRDLISA